jgi:hypothetical protein
MARKKVFQKNLQEAVWNNPELKEQYGKSLGKTLMIRRAEMSNVGPMLAVFSPGRF